VHKMSVDSNVPQIRFKGFSGEWVENDLGELIDIRSAARVHKEQWTKAGVPFFRTSDVVSIYKGQENAKVFISQEVYQGLSEKIGKLKKDDLLITGGGSIGIPYLVPNDDPLYFKDADLLWLKNDCKFDGYFLYTFFFSSPFKKYLKSISHIGTIAHYTIEQAKSTPINTCDTEEQIQIGNYFEKLDSLINQHQQKHDKLSNIKKAMLEKMFPKQGETIPEIRFKGFSGEWEHFTIESCSSLITKGTTPMTIGRSFVNRGISFVKVESVDGMGNLNQSKFAYINAETDQALARSRIKENDLLVSIAGALGRAAIVKKEILPANTNQALAIVRLKDDSPVGVNFLYHFTKTKDFKNFVDASASQGAQPNLSLGDISKVRIFAPTKEEQAAIGNYFQNLDTLINQHQQQITKLNNIKQACLSKMFV
jgi:type I restriction enzyme S subunit